MLIFALAISGCESGSSRGDASTSNDTTLDLTGSSTVAPLAAEIAKRYEEEHPDVRIDVQMGGSSRGISDARRGLADIGMVSRSLKEQEHDLTPHLIARDGICIIVNKDNPVTELTEEQIVAVYRGQIENWKELGGPDAEIVVVHKAEGRSTLELFLKHFGLENSEVHPDVVIGDNQQGIKTVIGNPSAIGYVSIGAAEYEASQGAPLKLLPLKGVPASIDNVRNGTFPLARELNLVTKGDPSGPAKQFIEFAQSAAVNDLIEGLYFVPVAK
jgi:phosphate transport system substrate-binding protein